METMIQPSLSTVLERRSWRELRVMAWSYGLSFNSNYTCGQAKTMLHQALLNEAGLHRSFRSLSDTERSALQTLQAHGGQIALHRFYQQYGEVRPYRPWHPEFPRQAWKKPHSITEKLWYLGFVEIMRGEPGQPDTICASAEILALLPPLPRPTPTPHPIPEVRYTPDSLRRDLAVLFGLLLHTPIEPSWGRWLPPRFLKQWNQLLVVREDLTEVRSELQTGRLRFLHYLAEVAGLVALINGELQPTAAAWAWLDAPPGEQWHILWEAWQADLRQRADEQVWQRYRFPVLHKRGWPIVLNELADLMPHQRYAMVEWREILTLYLPGDQAWLEALSDVLHGPLQWIGLVTTDGDFFTPIYNESQPIFQPTTATALNPHANALWMDLPPLPHLRPLVELLSIATLDDEGLRLDGVAIRRAVAQGQSAVQVAEILVVLSGQPISDTILHQLREWDQQATGLVIRPMLVLTSPDSALLADIRADRHLRRLTDAPLSAHHLAIPPHAAAELCSRLQRRGLPLTSEFSSPRLPDSTAPLSPQTAAYLWVAVRTYQRLGQFCPTPLRIPGAVLDWLTPQLPEHQAAQLSQSADTLLDHLAQTIAGRPPLPAPIAPPGDPAQLRAAIEAAYHNRAAITIDYFSPARGAVTRRTIEPLLPITESGGAAYIEAWCQLEQAARTFRLDRIVGVGDP